MAEVQTRTWDQRSAPPRQQVERLRGELICHDVHSIFVYRCICR